MIPHSRPLLDRHDHTNVLEVLKSGHLVQGREVACFEERLSSFIGVGHGAAVSSGTAALHLALIALSVGEGDEVIIPGYVCSALLNAVMYVRATPVIADIDGVTLNIDAGDVKRRITNKTKAVIVPHMFGLPADLDGIMELGVPVIEDCAQSVGAAYGGKRTGSFGVCSVYSFYTTKMIAAGEGGMLLSDDERFIETVRDLRDYDEKDTYAVRFNYKMTDIHAALGLSQLKKLPHFIQKRKEIADRYNDILTEKGVSIPHVPPGRDHAYFRYVIQCEDPLTFIDNMHALGIECRRPVYKPLHEYMGLQGYSVTDGVARRAVSIPLYPSLTDYEVEHIIKSLETLPIRD
jgi:dTDP-4-amino-4,6-dideoxygalactose transaminase